MYINWWQRLTEIISSRAFSTFSRAWFIRLDIWLLSRQITHTLVLLISQSETVFALFLTLRTVRGRSQRRYCWVKWLNKITETLSHYSRFFVLKKARLKGGRKEGMGTMCPVMSRHDSHFLLLLNLLLFLLIVLHYLQPLGLDQAALLNVELFFCLQEETQVAQRNSWQTEIFFT